MSNLIHPIDEEHILSLIAELKKEKKEKLGYFLIHKSMCNFLKTGKYGFRYVNMMRNRPLFSNKKRKHGGRLRKRYQRY